MRPNNNSKITSAFQIQIQIQVLPPPRLKSLASHNRDRTMAQRGNTQLNPPSHTQHEPRKRRDTGYQSGGTALRENATADRAKTSRACTLSGATPTPSAVQLSKTTGVPQVTTRARFHLYD